MVLWNISVSLFPLKTEIVDDNKTPKVVVLIPPPVDAGEAPINISIIVTITEPSCIFPMSIVLKPAVLDVTDIKKEDKIFPFRVKPSIAGPLCSIKKKARVPTKRRIAVKEITTFEWRLKFLNLFFLLSLHF